MTFILPDADPAEVARFYLYKVATSWVVEGGHMEEDGLHGVDGFRVVNAITGEWADDSFTQDEDVAREHARELNEEWFEETG